METLRQSIIDDLPEGIFAVDCESHSPYILCLVMRYVRGEVMLHSLEKYGIYIGTGSACSGKKTHKRLPGILGLTEEYEKGIIRVSFNRFSQENDINYFKKQLNSEYIILKNYVKG